ncbi:hypothetical protein [Mycobacterium sp.]|uniref:hypothetical protein n=1 Tax=Mycobacterium sp. TaxID=1785 RepID=UPI002D1FB808|nr:hypothetical protein [Mycobacterium sp.]
MWQSVLLPMITNVAEVRTAREIYERVARCGDRPHGKAGDDHGLRVQPAGDEAAEDVGQRVTDQEDG